MAFGTSVIDRMMGQIKGEIRRDWRAEGLACEVALSQWWFAIGQAGQRRTGSWQAGTAWLPQRQSKLRLRAASFTRARHRLRRITYLCLSMTAPSYRPDD